MKIEIEDQILNPGDILSISVCNSIKSKTLEIFRYQRPSHGLSIAMNEIKIEGKVNVSKQVKCPDCGMIFQDMRSLAPHRKIHKGKPEIPKKTAECPICKAILKNRAGLAGHLQLKHNTKIEIIGLQPGETDAKA